MQTASSFSSATVIVKKSGAPEAEINNEVIILDTDKGMYYSFNPVGSRIWQMLGERIAVGDICNALRAEYSIDAATCERQVIDVLEKMRGEGLIEVSG